MSNDKPKIRTKTECEERDEKGRFAPGNNGKPKGTAHKMTKELREFITNFLNDKSNEIPDMWEQLETKDKLTLFMHLCRLVLPKPEETPEAPDRNELKQPIWIVADNSLKPGLNIPDIGNRNNPEPITGMEIL